MLTVNLQLQKKLGQYLLDRMSQMEGLGATDRR